MKIRMDFVTNSSSSSYIIAVDKDHNDEFREMIATTYNSVWFKQADKKINTLEEYVDFLYNMIGFRPLNDLVDVDIEENIKLYKKLGMNETQIKATIIAGYTDWNGECTVGFTTLLQEDNAGLIIDAVNEGKGIAFLPVIENDTAIVRATYNAEGYKRLYVE